MESRKNSQKPSARLAQASDLPVDFTRIVKDVYTNNFSEGLKALEALQQAKSSFEVRGAIFKDEIVMSVSLVTQNQMPATTIYCSVDFDPKASSPTAQDLLNICVDAIGSIYATLLDPKLPKRIEQMAAGTLSALEEIPFQWTKVEFDQRRVWLLVDKSNPTLDEMTDRWLAENDPDLTAEEEEHEEKTQALFKTGRTKPGQGSGTLH